MPDLTPFDAYIMFSALKRHFNSKSYDYLKYNGKLKLSYESFIKRNDKIFFTKLSKKENPFDYTLSNLVVDSEMWIGDLFKDKAEKNYTEWNKRNQSLTYSFTNDIKYISAKEKTFREVLRAKDGQHPLLLEYYLETKISPETLLIINDLTRAFSAWTRDLDDKVLWPDIKLRLEKYHSFFRPKHPAIYFGEIILNVLGRD